MCLLQRTGSSRSATVHRSTRYCRTAALLILITSAACADAAGPPVFVQRRPPEETIPLTYPLRSVDGYALPYMVALTETGQLEIVAGFVALTEATHYFEQRTLWREIEGGEIREQLLVRTGRFERVADGFEVVTSDGDVLFFEVIGGNIYYDDRLFSYVYWR
jgi:hypothetical protein